MADIEKKTKRRPMELTDEERRCIALFPPKPAAEAPGYDAGKKIVGRKRHIAVDATAVFRWSI